MGIGYGRVRHSPTTVACASTVSGGASVPRPEREKRSAMKNGRTVFMTSGCWLEQGLRHDDDVPGQQRDVRIGAGVTLNRVDVHANSLLGALGRAVAAARLADERDARGRGELAEASRHRGQ